MVGVQLVIMEDRLQGRGAAGARVVCFLSFLFLFCSFGDEPRNELWELEMEGSICGGRGFCPCSYPRGGLKIKQNHHHHHIYIIELLHFCVSL